MHVLRLVGIVLTMSAAALASSAAEMTRANSADNDPAALEFFEKKIRPVLAARCYECHTGEKLKGGLRIDLREAIRKGGDRGPAVVPGDVDKSVLVKAIRYHDEKLKMPPKRALSDDEVADFVQWIKMGAPDPRDASAAPVVAKPAYDWEKAKQFWSFKPVVEPALPAVKDAAWSQNPVDRFVRAAQESSGVTPVGVADKRTLIRRATYDLTGLPPTVDDVEAFVNDSSPNAFSTVVERLLASPAYGERWGRHWLDVVRYADTSGCNSDYPIPDAYRYRDYVIDAFNADEPFDHFVKEQIAGDLMPANGDDDRKAKIIATGYLAIARRFGSRASEFHQTVEDLIDNVGKGMLGLSVSCARCHDHKFDPVPATDYYALYGIFNSTRYAFPGAEIYRHPTGLTALGGPADAARLKEYEGRLAWLDARTEELKRELGAAMRVAKDGPVFEVFGAGGLRAAAVDVLREAVDGPPLVRRADVATFVVLPASRVSRRVAELELEQEPLPLLEDPKTAVAESKPAPADLPPAPERPAPPGKRQRPARTVVEVKAEMQEVESELRRLEFGPPDVQTAFAAGEGLPQDARIQKKGDPRDLGDPVPRGFLTVLGGQQLSPGSAANESGRLELAQWIADASNPLTARVMVNRIWMHHFGRGIVATPNDFGARGEPPTHPELLDYLASRFVKEGWSVKAIHRLILSSRTYQLASAEDTKDEALDPSNKLVWRQTPRRLSAEEIRDAMLAVAGDLDRTPAGPHPFPEESTWRFTQHKPFVADYPTNHRSVYLMQQRIRKQPYLAVFDGADTNASTAQRSISTTAIQALYMMNDPLLHDSADKLAVRAALAFGDDAGRIDYAYRLAFARGASAEEVEAGRRYVAEMSTKLKAAGTPWDQVNRAAWASYARVILGSNEFVFVD